MEELDSLTRLPETLDRISKLHIDLDSKLETAEESLCSYQRQLQKAKAQLEKRNREVVSVKQNLLSLRNQKQLLEASAGDIEQELLENVLETERLSIARDRCLETNHQEERTVGNAQDITEEEDTNGYEILNTLDGKSGIASLQERIKALEDEKQSLGELVGSVSGHEHVCEIPDGPSREEMTERLKISKDKVSHLTSKLQQIEKDTGILKKRNQAQFLRLKRQVQEARKLASRRED